MTDLQLRHENEALANHARWVISNLSGPVKDSAKRCLVKEAQYILKKRQEYLLSLYVATSLQREPQEQPKIATLAPSQPEEETIYHHRADDYMKDLHMNVGKQP